MLGSGGDAHVTICRHTMTTRHISVTRSPPPAPSGPHWRVDLQTGDHQLVADEPTTNGGGDVGPSPFGLLLSGLAACTATTLRMYADRKGWALTTLEVDVRYTVTDDEPSIRENRHGPRRPSARSTGSSGRDRRAHAGDTSPRFVVARRSRPCCSHDGPSRRRPIHSVAGARPVRMG